MTISRVPLFYRGDFDEKITTNENEAVLNSDYHELMSNGPWGGVKTWTVRPGVHCVTGFGVANFTLVESDSGYILIDTGLNIGSGLEFLKYKREFGGRPIVAIIYSHNHYTGGARAIVEAFPQQKIEIYGHPCIEKHIFGLIEPGTLSHARER